MPARSDDEFMQSLTADGRQALSPSMDISGNAWFKYARDGRMVVAFDPCGPTTGCSAMILPCLALMAVTTPVGILLAALGKRSPR
ncbi:hypothetical protein OG589_39875 [Sphaerisporangium sp. NBC_01403]|uniref:hypothetical protein n=1 Tax=Sphaerisporangium sp. NBC_01403 TaxID=2903599 RepID=UPI0032564F15